MYRKKDKTSKLIFATFATANAPRNVWDKQIDGFKP